MLTQLLNDLRDIYTKDFKDIALHRDMIGYVCVVNDQKDHYILKLFKDRNTKQAKHASPLFLSCHDKPFFIDRYIRCLREMNYQRTDEFEDYGNLLWNRVKSFPRSFCHGDYHTEKLIRQSWK
jgi:hypothetical protein